MESDPHSIGVFDSGVGGLSILKALLAELPHEDFVYLADAAHAPYGERDEDYVIGRARAIVRQMRGEYAIRTLVVACNTATAAAIHLLRREFPDLPIVGVEPALKPAVALSKTRRIGVMATRGTLGSAKFAALHARVKNQAEFILQPCDGLADAIQNDDAAQVATLCAQYLKSIGPLGGLPGQVDTLVLGCTHYPFASREIAALAGPAVQLVETGKPVARQTRRLVEAAGLLGQGNPRGRVTLRATGALQPLEMAARRWLGL